MTAPGPHDYAPLTADQVKRRRRRSVAIALALAAAALIFYVLTIVKIDPNSLLNREL